MNNLEIVFEPTARGFERGEFKDLYGTLCSIQDSSLASEAAIWLGVHDPNPQIMVRGIGWQPFNIPDEVLFSTRMHLNQTQAAELIKVLQRFVNNGTIAED